MTQLFSQAASWARQYLHLLRLREFDTSTPEGRGLERCRRVALTGLAALGSKVVSVLTLVISVPLTLKCLGEERYGLWMTMSSLVLMMRWADLGLGLGLVNAISEAHGREDRELARRYVSSGMVMLSALALLLLLLFAGLYPLVPWPRVFNVQSSLAVREAGPALAALWSCFVLHLPLGVVQRVQLGYQEGFLNQAGESLGKILGLLGLVAVLAFQGGLVELVLAVAGAPVVVWLLNSLWQFGWHRPWLRPRRQSFDPACARLILRTGFFFLLIQTGLNLTLYADHLIIAQLWGAAQVTQYAVPQQMFNTGVILYTVFFSALWPAYSEALVRGEKNWARETLITSLKMIFLLSGSVAAVFVFFGEFILRIWVGSAVSSSWSLFLGFGVWSVMFSLGTAMSHFLNAANVFHFQILWIFITLAFSLIMKILLGYMFHLPGIIWGAVLSYFLCFLVPYALFLRTYFKSELNA